MTELHVECAGAGKTFSIAKAIASMVNECSNGKKVYAVTYTNYAVSQIKTEICNRLNCIPETLIIDTVHGFLLDNIIYPLSGFVKSERIKRCSIEKLSSNPTWAAVRKSQLKRRGEIHSSDVTQYARSIIVPSANDSRKVKDKKKVALDYLASDIFCIFVDEAQDMDKDFFDLMELITGRIEGFCFFGDPNQDLWGNNQYEGFISRIRTRYGITENLNMVSRRLPQCIVDICNRILKPEYQISSISGEPGRVEFVYDSELTAEERKCFSECDRFAIIKGSSGLYSTRARCSSCLPGEFREILMEKYPSYDIDAVTQAFVEEIDANGLSPCLKRHGITLDKQSYAKLAQQFESPKTEINKVRSIQKMKGLEAQTVYFVICNSLLEILLGLKNEYNKETNLLYVALTRTKNRLLLVIHDDDTMSRSFARRGLSIEHAIQGINIPHANKQDWF